MRRHLVVAALLACLAASPAFAQPPADPPAEAAAPSPGGDALPGTLQYQILHQPEPEDDPLAKSADEVLRQERRRSYPRANAAPKAPVAELNLVQTLRPVTAPSPKIGTFMAEDRRRAVLQGRSGPFAQAAAAAGDHDWFALMWALATLGTWLLGGGLVIWLGYLSVRAFSRH